MGRPAIKRLALREVLREVFEGRRLIRPDADNPNSYLVINYEDDIRNLRKLARRAKELGWAEIVEEEDGVTFRLLGERLRRQEENDVR